MNFNVIDRVQAFNVYRIKGNFYFYDGLKYEYVKTSEKVVYISGHDTQVTCIVLFSLTSHYQRESTGKIKGFSRITCRSVRPTTRL